MTKKNSNIKSMLKIRTRDEVLLELEEITKELTCQELCMMLASGNGFIKSHEREGTKQE